MTKKVAQCLLFAMAFAVGVFVSLGLPYASYRIAEFLGASEGLTVIAVISTVVFDFALAISLFETYGREE